MAHTEKKPQALSIFDVKELYDMAYAEREKSGKDTARFQDIMAEAVKLDMEYRRQLKEIKPFTGRFQQEPSKKTSAA